MLLPYVRLEQGIPAVSMNGRLRPILEVQLSDRLPKIIPPSTSKSSAIDEMVPASDVLIPTQLVRNTTKYADI